MSPAAAPVASAPTGESLDEIDRGINRLVLVTRKTRLSELVERFNSKPQAKFYIEHAGGDFGDYEAEDEAYRRSLDTLVGALDDRALGYQFQLIDRRFVSTYLFAEDDLIVTLGQDGLVANTAKYVRGRPLVAVNPDPTRHDGVLLPFDPTEVREAVVGVLNRTASLTRVTLARAELNDSQVLFAFNDLFIGTGSHVSARYRLHWEDRTEEQSSSGIIVSTGAGSSGWLSSVYHMVSGIASSTGNECPKPARLPWDCPDLVFVVREPFLSRRTGASVVTDTIRRGEELVIESLMPSHGVIFSDGMEHDFLRFQAGASVRIRAAEQQANLVDCNTQMDSV